MADRKLDKQKQCILECIRLYKDLPTLWNVKNKVYYDRAQKEIAYKILLRKYREWFPRATKQDLKKKLNTLRTSYRKELRKYLASVESGSDSVYKPTLWYYKEMSFLHNLQTSSAENAESPLVVGKKYAIFLDVDEENSNESQTSTYSTQESALPEPDTDMESTPHEPNVSLSHHEPTAVTNMTYENISENKDEYFHWAMSCASDLRKMERTQQVFAKKAIAEVLMEGQLGLLHRHSVKVNEPQAFGHSSESSVQFNASPTYIQLMNKHFPQNSDNKSTVNNPLEDDP